MAARTRVKARTRLVGVIATTADLRQALAMRHKPDLFELRLDCLVGKERLLERQRAKLGRPLIITARHPAEGGAYRLSTARRRDLLRRFLPLARYVDIELGSADALHSLLQVGGSQKVKRILSFHDFASTPSRGSLHAKARRAADLGADVFKVATRVETNAQLARLLEFTMEARSFIPLSVMGMGPLGAISRVMLAECGSIFTYVALANKKVEGQLTVDQFKIAMRLFAPARKSRGRR